MLRAARRLILGILLIVAASSVLVLSDRSASRPRGPGVAAPTRIAIVQVSSIDSMNAGREGAIDRLESAGHSRATGTRYDVFNAEIGRAHV